MWRTFLILVAGLYLTTCGDTADRPESQELASKTSSVAAANPARIVLAESRPDGQLLDQELLEAMLPKPAADVRNPRFIIGPDDRVQVTDTTVVPWMRVARIMVEYPDEPGNPYLCSGIMVQSTWVLTSGYCAYHSAKGGYITSALVIPALNDISQCPGNGCLFGDQAMLNAYVPPKFISDGDLGYNIGLIELDASPGVGYAGWSLASYAELMANQLYTAGYPGDLSVDDDFMYSTDDSVYKVTRNMIWNFIDFEFGQAGSGAWHSGLDLVGVMVTQAPFGPGGQSTVALRLRDELIAWMYQLFGGCANDCGGPVCAGATAYQDCLLGTDNCADLGPLTDCPDGTTCTGGECFPKGACGSCETSADCQTDGFCVYISGPPNGDKFCTIPCAATPPVCPTGYLCLDTAILGQSLDPPYQCLPGAVLNGGDICEACTPDNCPCTQDNECDDGWYCNGVETCMSGACAAGTVPVCDDGIPCTDDQCSYTIDDCVFTPNDANCDDTLHCNGVETCDDTLGCQDGTEVDCSDGVPCTNDACNEGTDSCDHIPDDANCDNGAYCDGLETCDLNAGCLDGTAVNCDDGIDCTSDACNDTDDSCDHNPVHSVCDNGLYCDGAEVCDPVVGCGSGTPPSCNDGVICTDDSCDEVNDGCNHVANDGSCDDGLYCNGTETCDANSGCQPGTDIDCSDGQDCTVDACDEGSDGCDNTPDHLLCTDGNECTNDTCDPVQGCLYSDNDGAVCTMGSCTGTCLAGACDGCVCTVDADCDDQVACTVDNCTAGVCTRLPDNGACDDGAFCNGGEICDPALGCQAGPEVVCDDGVACTTDSCNEVSDACESQTDHGACADGDACNGAEVCDAVLDCQPGVVLDCNDSNPCTDDSCQAASGCVHSNNTASCDDLDDCTMNDVCLDGGCAGEPLDLDDDGFVSDACQGDDCNDADADVNPGVDETDSASAICSDGVDNDCDGLVDVQEAGCVSCENDSECDDQNPCTDDSCQPASGGCVNADNSVACDDGDDCTMNDVCAAGICGGEPLDQDGDGEVPEECGGYDCDDSDETVHSEALENCHDGVDNDCNGSADQDDSRCRDDDDGGCNCSTNRPRVGSLGLLLLISLLFIRKPRYN